MKNKKNIALILVILAIVYIIDVHIYKRDSTDPHLSSFGFVFLFLAFFKSKKIVFNIIGFFLSALFFLEIFYFVEFRESLSIGVLDSIVETNKTESVLMLSHYIYPCGINYYYYFCDFQKKQKQPTLLVLFFTNSFLCFIRNIIIN